MAYNTIKLKKHADVIEEFTAHSTIIPGMLLELNSDSEVLPHDTAGGNTVPIMFALEDELRGLGIDDDFTAGDQVQVWIPGRGDQVYGLLKDDVDVHVGDFLESDGEGRLQPHVADVGDSTTGAVQQAIVGVVMADASSGLGSGSESSAEGLYHNPRVRLMII
jgi:hypothetical protein